MEELFRYPFLQHAFLAGAFAALGSSLVGFFLINRGMTFASHALPNIGFAGAAGAVLAGIAPVWGLFGFIFAGAMVFAALGREAHDRDVGIGVVMSFALGLGLFFLASYSGYAARVYGILFGTILGISESDVWNSVAAGSLTLAFVLLFYRPLLFSTVDPEQARVRGVPTVLLNFVFMALVAVTITVAIQVTGALLVFSLMVVPAAIAIRLSHRPVVILLISALLGQVFVFLSIVLAWAINWPVSFFVTSLAFLTYLAVRGVQAWKT